MIQVSYDLRFDLNFLFIFGIENTLPAVILGDIQEDPELVAGAILLSAILGAIIALVVVATQRIAVATGGMFA